MNNSKKRLLFSIFCLMTLALLISLGTWQVKRLMWKEELIRTSELKLSEPAYTESQLGKDPADLSYRKIKLAGSFLHQHEILLSAKFHKKRFGHHVITPFRTIGNRYILVNRGWVPRGKKLKENRPGTIFNQEIVLEGIIKTDYKKPKWFMPQNDPARNEWMWLDIKALQNFFATNHVIPLEPFIVRKTSSSYNKSDLPIALETKIKLRNDHLGYAITWYGLAFVVLVMYVIFIRKRNN